MISAFPKIFAIGTDYISRIFDNEVEVTEKIDGSQFVFGRVKGELYMRSKGQQLYIDNPEKMFFEGMDYIVSIENIIPDDTIFYCEYLKKPKHNTLVYDRIPENHLMLFGASSPLKSFDRDFAAYALDFRIEPVPILYKGKIESVDMLMELLQTDSVLGNCKVEGVVVKNYDQPFLLGGQPIPLMMGKFVSEAFKEVHNKNWKEKSTHRGRWETFKMQFRSEARWQKAVQHLAEKGALENEPRDIGKLIKEIQRDIIEEESGRITDFLMKEFGSEVTRYATGGFPEWYKEELAKRVFNNKEGKRT